MSCSWLPLARMSHGETNFGFDSPANDKSKELLIMDSKSLKACFNPCDHFYYFYIIDRFSFIFYLASQTSTDTSDIPLQDFRPLGSSYENIPACSINFTSTAPSTKPSSFNIRNLCFFFFHACSWKLCSWIDSRTHGRFQWNKTQVEHMKCHWWSLRAR